MTPDDDVISRAEVLDILHNAHKFYQSETAISVVPLLRVTQLIESLPAAAPVVKRTCSCGTLTLPTANEFDTEDGHHTDRPCHEQGET